MSKQLNQALPAGGVSITLGGGAEFYIDNNNQMGFRKFSQGNLVSDIPLGLAYENNLNNLILHIGSLRIHTIRQ